PGTEGRGTRDLPDGREMSIYDAATRYADEGVPLVVLAGKEYGSGSSRDWAAKGTMLLGVKAVIAQSYERIHRSNLIGMGVLPLQFPEGESADSLGLTGTETFSITGVAALGGTVHVTADDVEFDAGLRRCRFAVTAWRGIDRRPRPPNPSSPGCCRRCCVPRLRCRASARRSRCPGSRSRAGSHHRRTASGSRAPTSTGRRRSHRTAA